LINHLKYGLAEPAIVVSITPEWVKVAAYTAEFDGIVVLGFPTEAIDIIAPGKERPAVGTRLLVVSLFTPRDGFRRGVQPDITMGPRTLGKFLHLSHLFHVNLVITDKFYNFQPLVAQFMTDDFYAPIWEERMGEVDEDLWGDIWEAWLAWKVKHGTNYFRLGAPSTVCLMATNHVTVDPPGYTP
jgi:hypothetical protein